MDYFRKILTGPQSGQVPSGAETVERLCDRVQSSTLLEDRRDAVRALKSLSKKFRIEVGTMAMDILINVLRTDGNDTEIIGYALETLCNIMSNEPFEDDQDPSGSTATAYPEDLGQQFTEMFLKQTDNVGQLLTLLQEYDFHVLWPTVRLLTQLLAYKTREIQEIILANPMGISKLMDLLVDSREIIRNDGLLLLIQLTRNNTNIQKIVAFENAFERLFDIIRDEGNSDGGMVVEDCLLLLLNLLKNNISNQNFLKEGSYIQRFPVYFDLQQSDRPASDIWSAQKVTNVHLMLELVRTLVSPTNPQQQTASCQKLMNQCGLLEKLCTILMASGVPADVLTETINTVAELIRGNQYNQEYFASVMAPSSPPRPAIVVLLMSMVNEKQPFVLRCAVLYCFVSFLYKNDLGQSQIVQTLLPSTAEANSVSAGQLLCGGLFSTDPLSTWFAAVALLHAIVDNPAQKEQLLRVQLATSLGHPPVSLLQQCTNILTQGAKLQTRVGLLMLLCHWLSSCPVAVTHFLHSSSNVPFLISQVSASEGDELELIVQGLCAFLLGICVIFNSDQVPSYHKTDLRQIIAKRIGTEQFTDKLTQISKHETYSRAAKKPQLSCKLPTDVIFDFEFTRLFRRLENEVLKAVLPTEDGENDDKKKDQHDSVVVDQYKKIIRDQDVQLNAIKSELSELLSKNAETQRRLDESLQQIQLVKDQNALLKAQRVPSGASVATNSQIDADELARLHLELDAKQQEINEGNLTIERLKSELAAASLAAAAVNGASESAGGSADVAAAAEDDELRKRLEMKEEEVRLYRNKYEECSRQLTQACASKDDSASRALIAERNMMELRLADLERRNAELEDQLRRGSDPLELRLQQLTEEMALLQKKLQAAEAEKAEIEVDREQMMNDFQESKKEQEDLLVLLADQDTKLKTYRQRLRQLGEQIEDDDDDDDEVGGGGDADNVDSED
jgi:hypothetical protein